MKSIIAGFKDVHKNLKDFIAQMPTPPTEQEVMLARLEKFEKRYDGLTKKYWDNNSHLLDDDNIFLKIYGDRI